MTIVVWDGRYVVSDSLAIRGSLRCENEPKLRAVDGKVYAVIGRAAMFDPLVEWHRNGADPEKFPKASPEDKVTDFLVFDGDQCSMYSVDLPYPDRMYGPTAWGCGRDFAIGAMAAGKNAVQAAEIAISKDYNLGGPVQVIDLQSLVEWLVSAAGAKRPDEERASAMSAHSESHHSPDTEDETPGGSQNPVSEPLP